MPACFQQAGHPLDVQQTASHSIPTRPKALFQGACDQEEIHRQADNVVRNGKVQPSTSTFGEKRVGCNPLNKITVKQKIPMPQIDDFLDSLQSSALYSSFDSADAFLRIPAHLEDAHKSAQTRTCVPEIWACKCACLNADAG